MEILGQNVQHLSQFIIINQTNSCKHLQSKESTAIIWQHVNHALKKTIRVHANLVTNKKERQGRQSQSTI